MAITKFIFVLMTKSMLTFCPFRFPIKVVQTIWWRKIVSWNVEVMKKSVKTKKSQEMRKLHIIRHKLIADTWNPTLCRLRPIKTVAAINLHKINFINQNEVNKFTFGEHASFRYIFSVVKSHKWINKYNNMH